MTMNVPYRLLTWAVHATGLGVLAVSVVTTWQQDRLAVASGGVLLGLLYAAAPATPGPARAVWLGLVSAGWAVLAVAAPPFVWLAFPLLFAYLHVLPLWAAMFGVSVLTSSAIIAAAWHAGELTLPLLVGPGVAAAVVTLLALACKALRAELGR
ncbi:hypothetical protein AB0K12_36580 [Nonomuraea sp. NPDC049419]|uniref:hypothetical protein n=1 Tax=Nonomuraea sp. NPDC049419 TaxID=3155772 RepID=UPI00341C6BD4